MTKFEQVGMEFLGFVLGFLVGWRLHYVFYGAREDKPVDFPESVNRVD